MAEDAAPPPAAAAAAVTPAPRRWLRAALLALLALLLLALLALAAALASLRTEAGTRWWVEQATSRIDSLEVSGVQGALLGAEGRLAIDRLRLAVAGTRIAIDGLAWDGLRLSGWQRQTPFVDLHLTRLSARALDIVPPPARLEAPPMAPPVSLELPLTARIDALAIDRLTVAGLPAAIETLRAKLVLGPQHRVDDLSLRWRGLAVDAQFALGAQAPLPLEAALAVRSVPTDGAAPALLPAWASGLAGSLRTQGPLAGFNADLAFVLQGQRLQASARVAPFEPLPLTRLDSRFEQLDLQPLGALFDTTAPATRLDGQIAVQLAKAGALTIDARVANAVPGGWDQGRVPVAALELAAAGSGRQWKISRGQARLVGERGARAGLLTLAGEFDLAAALPGGELRLALEAVDLPLLDSRLPPLRLNGPLRLRHQPPAAGTDVPFGLARLEVDLNGRLSGEAARQAPTALRAAPVTLQTSVELEPRRLELTRLQVASGVGTLQGTLRFDESDGLWRGAGRLALRRFDPSQWAPGNPNAAWRQARNELNGEIRLNGRAALPGADLSAWLQGLEGSLDATLTDDSRLAGVALAASATVRAQGRGGLDASIETAAAGNSARGSLSLAGARGAAARDAFDLQIDAPYLNRVASLAAAAGIDGLTGNAQFHLETDGGLSGWLLPGTTGAAGGEVRTRGVVDVDGLRAGGARIDRLHGRWQATLPPRPARGAATDALGASKLAIDLRAARIQVPGIDLPGLALHADGTLAEHRAVFRTIVLPAAPAEGSAEQALQPRAIDIELDGTWRAEPGDRQRWQARVGQVLVQTITRDAERAMLLALAPPSRSAPRTATQAGVDDLAPATLAAWPRLTAALPLLEARDIRLEALFEPDGFSWSVTPGKAELAGAALSWQTLAGVHAEGAAPQIDLSARLEPFELVILLKRLRPDVGWNGDLRVGGRLDLRARDRQVKLDFELARTGGDLALDEFGTRTTLGLTEALINVTAEGGRWRLVQRLAGTDLGRIDSEFELLTTPQALFPGPEAALSGRLDAKVESLAGWAAWVPAGWRLGGQIDAELTLAGRVGAPSVEGQITGRELQLRNALVGVNLRDGVLDFVLAGETADLRRLRFAAGDGSVEASGTSRLGANPSSSIELVLRQATVLGRVDRRVVVSGDARARLVPNSLTVRGAFTVDEGLIDISQRDAPSLGDDVKVVRGGMIEEEAVAQAAPRASRETELDVRIGLGQNLRLQGRGLRTKLVGDLRLTTLRGALRADGEIRTDGGMFEAFAQRLEIDRGVITFVGDPSNPRLEIEAIRPNLEQRVGARITGTVNNSRVVLFSEPAMTDIEKLTLLLTGRPHDNLGGTDALVMQRAALALLAGADSGPGTRGLLRLDEFSIRQTDGASRDTVVAVGRQVSDRVYIGFETGGNDNAGAVQITYRIGRRFTLRASGGETSALDLIWLFRWD